LKKPEFKDALTSLVPEVGMIKPGDACMAAHFTSQCGDLEDAKTLLLHGRCISASVLQTYRMTVIFCSNFAIEISVLTILGVKLSDMQNVV